MKKLSIEELKTVVLAVLLMIMGVLFCCSLAMGIDGLSVVIGLVLMVVGVIFLLNSVLNNKTMITMSGLIGVGVLSLGIMFIASKLAGLIFAYIPWVLIVLGLVLMADGLINKFVNKSEVMLTFVLKMILAVIAITLGLCLRLIDGFAEYASIVLGVLMIAYSLYMIVTLFIGGKTTGIVS